MAHHGDHRNPAPPEELQEKFVFLTEEALGKARCREVMETVARLEELPDIRELTALLRCG